MKNRWKYVGMLGFGLYLLIAVFWPLQTTAGRRGRTNFDKCFGLDKKKIPSVKITLIESNAPGCLFFPGEKPELTYQLVNKTNKPIKTEGALKVIQFASRSIVGDIWNSRTVRLRDVSEHKVDVDLSAKGWQNIVFKPTLPEEKGCYGLVLDLRKQGRDFIGAMARIFVPDPTRVQYPKQALDNMRPSVLNRLGVKAIRKGWGYVHSSREELYARRMKQLDEEMAKFHENKVTIALEFGAGRYDAPMDMSWRPHLTEEDVLKGGKGDAVWMPKDDKDFEEFVYKIACKYGWPKGPITAFMLWNEPWEGLSISGWGADMIRYRKIYKHMGKATARARRDAGVDILVGGCDSSSNSWDKLFPDGSDEFMPYYDFCSIHYQGMSAPVLHPEWINRKVGNGRVLIWDTESWVANTDDRVATVVATNRAAGYDRSLGIKFDKIVTQLSHNRKVVDRIHTPEGTVKNVRPLHAWPVAPSLSAVQHFIGERNFQEILFKNGLPWVYLFDGLKGNRDDGTIVITGDIGTAFNKPDCMLFRTVRSAYELREKTKLREEMAKLPEGSKEREELAEKLRKPWPRQGSTMTIKVKPYLQAFDFYGNPVATADGKLTIPLNANGFFLRADPEKKGSYRKLVEDIRNAQIKGLEPLEIIPHDFLKPIGDDAGLKLVLTNVLNQPVRGKLDVEISGLTIQVPDSIELSAHQTKTYRLPVTGKARSDNSYPLVARFKSAAGNAEHRETLHVNRIANRTINVDGKLDDWKGALPQTIISRGKAHRSLTEAAWLPFESFKAKDSVGVATAFLAYDDKHFYFGAKVADNTPSPGSLRFSEMDPDEFFYPKTVYTIKKDKYGVPVSRTKHTWPDGVRRFTYRKWPVLFGHGWDHIQISFNAIPIGEDGWLSHLPGRMPGFIRYKCTDYEYCLVHVAPKYGGGTEVFRAMIPGMPRKHFYPRQPKHPLEGEVKNARLITRYEENTRITEVAIPWEEIPHVKKQLDSGKTVKFSYRVNHGGRVPTMELAQQRSVSKINDHAFHPDWRTHWANELEFSFEK